MLRKLNRVPWFELIRFGVSGMMSVAVYLAILAGLTRVVPNSLWFAAAVAYLLSMVANYWLQKRFTFRSDRRHDEAVTRYVLVQGVGLALNSVVLWILVTKCGGSLVVAQVIAVLVVAIWSYTIQKFWIFLRAQDPS